MFRGIRYTETPTPKILQLRFMQEASRTDDEVSELLGLERSTYYDHKKEAILLMGISLYHCTVSAKTKSISSK